MQKEGRTMAATVATPTRDDLLARRVRLSVAEYEHLGQAGILAEQDRVELIDGWVVRKMPRDPLHDGTVRRLLRGIQQLLPPAWDVRCQLSLVLDESVPEPDNCVERFDPDDYTLRHPTGADTGLVAEVANSSLAQDRTDKLRIYARAGIPAYWIVNVVDGQIEAYARPAGDAYAQRQDYRPGEAMPLVLDGVHVGDVPVALVLG